MKIKAIGHLVKTNPIKANFRKGKIDAKCVFTKDYRKKDDFAVRKNKPNSNPISIKPKMSANVYVIEDYENETAFRPKKTNPNKPNFRKAKMNLKSLAKKSGHTFIFSGWIIACLKWGFRLYYQAWFCKRGKNNEQAAACKLTGRNRIVR